LHHQGNTASQWAGGIENDGRFGSATMTINDSTISGNSTAIIGAGIYNRGDAGSATMTINNSTISGNSVGTGGYGGGIFNDGDFGGNATLTIRNSTINGNSAGDYGGGIFSEGFQGSVPVTINNSTISDKGKNFGGSTTDQRATGFARAYDNLAIANATGGDGTDIGAFEVQAAYAARSSNQSMQMERVSSTLGSGVVPVKFTLSWTVCRRATCRPRQSLCIERAQEATSKPTNPFTPDRRTLAQTSGLIAVSTFTT
jgi:hypothetical protein